MTNYDFLRKVCTKGCNNGCTIIMSIIIRFITTDLH